MRALFVSRLSHRRLPWLVAASATLLCLPALWGGLFSDDWIHRAIVLGAGPFPASERPLLDLFRFVHPSAPHTAACHDLGLFPWWADPDVSIAFLRPVTSLTHLLDLTLWPDAIAVQHAHSLAWLALAVGLVALLYRKVGGVGATAGLAAVLFAVEDAHALPAAWLANRNAVIALALGTAGLLAHLHWRRTGRAAALMLALGLMSAALLAAEAALGALAYVLAWQLTMDPGRWRDRLLRVAPYAALVLAWRGLYDALGYGARGSGLYIDPGQTPIAFTRAVIERGPLLLAGQWLQAPLDAWILLPPADRAKASGAAALVVLGLALLLLPLLRRRAEARFWALGMVLAVVPLCASFPMDRLLIFAGVGAAPLLALLAADQGWLGGTARGSWRLRRWALGLLLALHLPVAATLLCAKTAWGMKVFAPVPALMEHLDDVAGVEDRTVVFVNGHDLLDIALVYGMAHEQGRTPHRILQLGSVTTPLEVSRVDERTLELRQVGGLLSMAFDTLLRDPDHPIAAGEAIERPDAHIEVLQLTPQGLPYRWRVRFDKPLEDPGYHFVRIVMTGAETWTPPAVGASTRLDLALHGITAPQEHAPRP